MKWPIGGACIEFWSISSNTGSVCDVASVVRAGDSVWVVDVTEKVKVTRGSDWMDTAAVFSIDDSDVVVWFICLP